MRQEIPATNDVLAAHVAGTAALLVYSRRSIIGNTPSRYQLFIYCVLYFNIWNGVGIVNLYNKIDVYK